MYSMRNAGVGYSIPQGTPMNRIQSNNYTYSSSQSRTGPSTTYQSSSRSVSMPTRNVNPALSMDSSHSTFSSHQFYGQSNNTHRKQNRGEIDDSPIIDPRAFQYLNTNDRKTKKKDNRSNEIESGIDSRPIINLDAVKQLERRRQQQIEKNNRLRGDDGSKSGIDDRSIIDVNAFRYIEARTNQPRENQKQGHDDVGGIDDRPITNPDAFKYLDARRAPKPFKPSNEPAIDTRPIIDPDAFRYVEKREVINRNMDSGIDSTPIVDPNAFRYLENTAPSSSNRDVQAGVDTTSIVNPDAFRYIEKRSKPKLEPNEPSVDYRPIVNPQAFKWIERQQTTRVIDDGPSIDDRSYVNPQAFRFVDRQVGRSVNRSEPTIDTRSYILNRNPNALAHLERKYQQRQNVIDGGGVDERSYVSPDAFRFVEGLARDSQSRSIHSSSGPSIDTRSYVNTDSFRHLENSGKSTNYVYDDWNGIDERSYVPNDAFRHLEYSEQPMLPCYINYPSYGLSDV